MSWFQEFKSAYDVPALASVLGLHTKKLNTFGPCVACGMEQRGSDDRRGPIGISSDRRGWKCHRCSAAGDVLDLVSYVKASAKSRDLSKAQWADIRSWLIEQRLVADDSDTPRVASMGTVLRAAQPTAVSTPAEASSEGVEAQSAGPFGFREGRAEECAQRMWTDEGAAVLAYLTASADQGGRGFTHATIREFQLGCEFVSGQWWLTIPLKDVHQRVVNLKFRSVPPDKKTFRAGMGRPLPLFGVDRISGISADTIVCVEGELDVVAMWQYGFKDNVVSTTAGAGTMKGEWLDVLEPYAAFVMCYDDDEKGKEGAAALVKKLGAERCSMAVLPLKDANDCLASGIPAETIKRAINGSKPCIDVSFKQAHDYVEELERLINNPQELMGRTTGSNKLDQCIGGIRPGLMVITGGTGHGKSSAANWLCWEQARRGSPVMLTSFENRPIGTVQKLIRMELGGDFTKYSADERRQALGDLGAMPLYIMDHYGHLTPKKMVDSIKYAVRRYGVQTVLIDHLGFMVTSGSDERAQIENVVRELAVVAYSLKVTIMLICHPRTLSSEAQRVTLDDLKGASAIKQDASEVIVIVRDPPKPNGSPPRHWPATWFYVDKCRSEFGSADSKALLAFGPLSLVYADTWEQVPESKTGSVIAIP